MADRAINELIEATQMLPADLFVLQQDGQAKKLSGQTFINFLTKLADGHGGIVSVIKTRTSGLVDTYTITLADRSTSTFTVTNGAKGDTGAQTYVWIKYASVNPESYPHSFGDLPAPWMGIYTGLKSSAPTLWSDYKWFEIKGLKGDKGDPAKVTRNITEYMASDSGTIPPNGSWQPTPPNVVQGQYLWSRSTIDFNSGDPLTVYGVSRIGMDGKGSVSSFAGYSPDKKGNIDPATWNLESNHPVGSWWFSDDPTSPAALFGGTWEKLIDRGLFGAGGFYPVGTTGGEREHLLTIDEMPSFVVKYNIYSTGEGAKPDKKDVPQTTYTNQYAPYGLTLATGGGKAHNIMDPFYATYMWRRTA